MKDEVLVSGSLTVVLGSDGFTASRKADAPWSAIPPFKLTGEVLADFDTVPDSEAMKLSSEARAALSRSH